MKSYGKQGDHCLDINERKIFAVCSDGHIRVGSRNPKNGNRDPDSRILATADTLNYLKHIPEAQWAWVDLHDSSGHPTLLIPDARFDGRAYCGGWLVKRIKNGEECIEVLFQSGRLGRDLTRAQTEVLTKILTATLQQAYGSIEVTVHQSYAAANQGFWKRTPHEDKGNLGVQRKYPQVVLATHLLSAVEKAVENHKDKTKETKFSFLHQHSDQGIKKNELLLSLMKQNSTNFCIMLNLLKNYFNDQPLDARHKVAGAARSHPHSFISFLLQEIAKNPILINAITEITRCNSDLRFNQIFTEDNLDFTSKAADKFRSDAFQYLKKIIIPQEIPDDLAMQMLSLRLQG